MIVDDIAYAHTQGSARLFAVELGVVDFGRELTPAEASLLLLVDHLDAHGVEVSHICPILRWLSKRLDRINLGDIRRPTVVTLLDYNYVVCSFEPRCGFDFKLGEVLLDALPRSYAVSTAFALSTILSRKLRAIDALKSAAAPSRASSGPTAAP